MGNMYYNLLLGKTPEAKNIIDKSWGVTDMIHGLNYILTTINQKRMTKMPKYDNNGIFCFMENLIPLDYLKSVTQTCKALAHTVLLHLIAYY